MSGGLQQQERVCAALGEALQRHWATPRALRFAAGAAIDDRLREALLQASSRSAAGASLAEALDDAALPGALREAAASLAAGGEGDVGRLLQVLGSAAVERRRMRRRLAIALAYPAVVIATTAAAGLFVVHRVLPLLEAWRAEAAWASPPPSVALPIARAVFGLPGAALVIALALLVVLLARVAGLDLRALVAPPLVATSRAGALAALAALLRCGLTLDESLARLGAWAPRSLDRALRRARAAAAQGSSPTDALVAAALVPEPWAGPLRAAEQTDDDGWAAALEGVGRTLALEGRLGAARHRIWVLTGATLLAGALVLCVGLALFGGMHV